MRKDPSETSSIVGNVALNDMVFCNPTGKIVDSKGSIMLPVYI
jgi:hypothetical protein